MWSYFPMENWNPPLKNPRSATVFSDGMGNAKIKIMHIINANAIRGLLSENY